jgi:hypothetical protein
MTTQEKPKWEVKTATWPMGDTGDYDSSIWITNGKIDLILQDNPIDGIDEDDEPFLKNLCDVLNSAPELKARCEEQDKEIAELKDKLEKMTGMFEATLIDYNEQKSRVEELEAALRGIERECDGNNPAHENIWRIAHSVLESK